LKYRRFSLGPMDSMTRTAGSATDIVDLPIRAGLILTSRGLPSGLVQSLTFFRYDPVNLCTLASRNIRLARHAKAVTI